ncbi:MAG: cytochrome b/b6 domain-containing protein [Pseudomonadota bacterium]
MTDATGQSDGGPPEPGAEPRSTAPRAHTPDGATVKAWDVPTRLFHWLLVALIINAYLTRYYYDDIGLFWHMVNGYALLILIAFRVLWGLFGTSTAQFRSFIYSPVAIVRYGIDFITRKTRLFLGHNPLGGFVVVVMLGLIALQGVTGLFAADDILTEAPLVSTVSSQTAEQLDWIHENGFDWLLYLIGLHIFASFAYLVWKRENLILPMLTGRKEPRAYEDEAQARVASPWLALLLLGVATALVLGPVYLLNGALL